MTPPPAVNFDAVARPYRWMEYLSFGRSLERCRYHFLPALAGRRRALVLGDGDGRFVARLLAANPELDADAVDISAAMLRLLARRAAADAPERAGRLRTYQGNALEFTPEGSYDLIVTHFFLDCFTQPEVDALARRLAGCSAAGAMWVVSDFRIPAGAMRWPARAIVRLLYLGFRLLTGLRTTRLPDYPAALQAAGFVRGAQHLSLGGLLTTELWTFSSALAASRHPGVDRLQGAGAEGQARSNSREPGKML